jgi:hypothetical protein
VGTIRTTLAAVRANATSTNFHLALVFMAALLSLMSACNQQTKAGLDYDALSEK